jgi:hypothetical protein
MTLKPVVFKEREVVDDTFLGELRRRVAERRKCINGNN